MNAGQRKTDLDLRIAAGARLSCDLSARVGEAPSARDRDRRDSGLATAPDASAAAPWLRALLYLAFASAITVPWLLLLVNQIAP